MHFTAYVLVPLERASTSTEARHRAYDYLMENEFVGGEGRWGHGTRIGAGCVWMSADGMTLIFPNWPLAPKDSRNLMNPLVAPLVGISVSTES